MNASAVEGSCSLDMSGNRDYFKYGFDNSAACYLTNYLLTAGICWYIYMLYSERVKHTSASILTSVLHHANVKEHTRFLMIGKYMCTAVSVSLAAFVHQGLFARAGDLDDSRNKIIWYMVEATLISAGGFTFNAAWALSHTVRSYEAANFRMYAVVFGIGVITILVVLISVGVQGPAFAICGTLGEFLPDIVFVAAVLFPRAEHREQFLQEFGVARNAVLLAIFVIFLGAYVQVFFGPACGVRCPVGCLLPAPTFNHNAFFHVMQLLGMGILTYAMRIMCRSIERCKSIEESNMALLS